MGPYRYSVVYGKNITMVSLRFRRLKEDIYFFKNCQMFPVITYGSHGGDSVDSAEATHPSSILPEGMS